MIAHETEGTARSHQLHDELGHLQTPGATIDEIAEEQRQPSFSVAPAAVHVVAEMPAQGQQGIEVSVDVADGIYGDSGHGFDVIYTKRSVATLVWRLAVKSWRLARVTFLIGACAGLVSAGCSDPENNDPIDHGQCELIEDPVERPGLPERPDDVDYLIIAADHLLSPAQTHAEYRDETGHRAEVLSISDALDDGRGGVVSDLDEAIDQLRDIIAEYRDDLDESRTMFVLLLGDVNRGWEGHIFEVPAAEVPGFEWSEAQVVTSDNAIADLDGDHVPDVAIGRIPVNDSGDASAILRRVRELESGYRVGPWNYQVPLFASEAGMGEFIDGLIEDAAFDAVSEVPTEWQLSFTYARPASEYAYPPALFSDHIYDVLNSGSILTAYIGHGSSGGFDDVNWDGEREPILDTADLDDLDMTIRPSVLAFIACLTGAFDTGTSLVERFIREPGGPVAIIAATELSHPYANAVLVREMALTTLQERRRTVGEAMLEAKVRVLANGDDPVRQTLEAFGAFDPSTSTPELRENLLLSHEQMYSLIGDPALVIAYPAGTVEFDVAAEEVVAGEEIEACVQVHGPPAGHAVVTLETDREVIGYNLESWDMDDSDRDEVVVANHALANDKVLESWEGEYEGGGFFISFPTDPAHTGLLTIRVYTSSEEGLDALGSTEVRVLRDE